MDFAGFEPALNAYFYANKPPVWKVQKKDFQRTGGSLCYASERNKLARNFQS